MSQGRSFRFQSRTRNGQALTGQQNFRCLHCKMEVSCAPLLSGVQNRNHCPYCLWSRHLDWRVSGDRLSACRAGMRPVGLTTKQRRNKYAGERDGELMIIHQCIRCAKLVINRIAADDGDADLLELFEASCAPDAAFRMDLAGAGIAILAAHERDLVQHRLLGIGSSQRDYPGVQFSGFDQVDFDHDLVLTEER